MSAAKTKPSAIQKKSAGLLSRTNRVWAWFVFAVLFFTIASSAAAWSAVSALTWARDIPNRIVIEGGALASSFGTAVSISYHDALRNGDSSIQLQILNEQFAPLLAESAEAATWIRLEFRDDILALVDSANTEVATAAAGLIEIMDSQPEVPVLNNDG